MASRITIFLITLLTAYTATAQNRIDHFVDSGSTFGQSKFTSVIERDPDTHEVIRVVKVRELTRGIDINACLELFGSESRDTRLTHKIEDTNRHTLVMTVDSNNKHRIYMLQYTGNNPMQAHDGKVTIVIKMKNK